MNKLYLCRDGTFLVVPAVMQPPLEATKAYGPLMFAGYAKLRVLDSAVFARVCRELDDQHFSRLTRREMAPGTRIFGTVQGVSGADLRMVDDLVRGFRSTVAGLCESTCGSNRVEAVNREYEAILSRSPRDLLDAVHEQLAETMREYGIGQANWPASF
ncbi:MAG: hypothetical protein ACJ8GK_02510 [Luteimonas sp.]